MKEFAGPFSRLSSRFGSVGEWGSEARNIPVYVRKMRTRITSYPGIPGIGVVKMGPVSDEPILRGVTVEEETAAAKFDSSETPIRTSSKVVCPKCRSKTMRRMPRHGFWQNVVLSWFGLYPWECVFCRKVHYFRYRGLTRRRRSSSERDSQ